jgi:L-fuculose-phosphate aldolase
MSAANDREKRQSIIDACLRTSALGINQGTSGNISLRHQAGMLVTPTDVPYETMRPEQVVFMGLDGSFDPTLCDVRHQRIVATRG